MDYNKLRDVEKRSLNRITNTCSEVLKEVKSAIGQTVDTWQQPLAATEKAQEKLKKRKNKLPKGGGFLRGLGIYFAVTNGILFLSFLLAAIFDPRMNRTGAIILIVLFGLLTAGAAALSVFGKRLKEKRNRYETYLRLIGNQDAVSIHAIADSMEMDYRDVITDLKDMIRRGILSPAWLDLKTYRLMLTEFTGEVPVEKKEECLSRSERILKQIRADNDLIADEEVSAKIDRIEDLTRKIFAVLDQYPEKEKQLYSFLNYYLPTTMKALENYARLEAQGVETKTITETKQKINGMLDDLCDGYEKQLDKLFENEAVDITADIEVMRRMMQRDGLKENEFTAQ